MINFSPAPKLNEMVTSLSLLLPSAPSPFFRTRFEVSRRGGGDFPQTAFISQTYISSSFLRNRSSAQVSLPSTATELALESKGVLEGREEEEGEEGTRRSSTFLLPSLLSSLVVEGESFRLWELLEMRVMCAPSLSSKGAPFELFGKLLRRREDGSNELSRLFPSLPCPPLRSGTPLVRPPSILLQS